MSHKSGCIVHKSQNFQLQTYLYMNTLLQPRVGTG